MNKSLYVALLSRLKARFLISIESYEVGLENIDEIIFEAHRLDDFGKALLESDHNREVLTEVLVEERK